MSDMDLKLPQMLVLALSLLFFPKSTYKSLGEIIKAQLK